MSRSIGFAVWVLAFGLLAGRPAKADSFIAQGATWRYLKGTQEASPDDITAWRQLGFNDSSWSSGPEPVFYGEPLTGVELPDMRGGYTSVYFRKTFTVANPGDVQTLTLRVLSDDGFVAWINGQEVARFNVPNGDLAHDATAITTFNEPLPLDDYPVNNPGQILRAGENIITIHGFNASLGNSSDFVMDPRLDFTVDNSSPVVTRVIPVNGSVVRSLDSIEIDFSEAVTGVDATDLLVNGQPATSVQGFGPGQYLFVFPKQPAGVVTAAFRANHGITDLAGTPHPFTGGSWGFTVDPNAPLPGVQINEFMANNAHTLRDEDGDRSDWLELFNAGTSTISLTGWALSDDPAVARKWVFPPVSLQPNAFLVIYASGKNRTNDLSRLHTNFKLTSDAGGFLALTDAAGDAVSAFPNYPAQQPDVSYGRANGAPNVVGYFVKPTPGAANSERGDGFAPPVDFSVSSRAYLGSLGVNLSTTNGNAAIHYTTDGSMPTEASLRYTDQLIFSGATQLRARAFVPGLLPGPPRSETYIPLANPVAAFASDLPVMIIHDFNRGSPPANSETYASVQVFEPDTNGVTSLTNAPTLVSRAAIAARGSSTEGYPKVSLKLEFHDEFDLDRDV
ncbi:MAG TPA: lamin tail domain-containing protein, partial [Verrucomicrobiae bacterium]|nr:lamin tail domain-containing protein [Verrucomicrobiae bacterium]